jgi:hypothetical protein
MRRSTEGQLMSLISLGDGSTLTLDFTTGVLDPRLTFTRASGGTFINASGLVATASNNVARFDHDPTTLTPRGLLIEGSATNLGSYSEDFSNAAWTKSGTNGSMVLTGTAPDNNATSRLLEENTTSYAKHSLERSISISAGIHTLSVWLKEPSTNSRRYAHIQLADGQATAARYTIVADLQTGTIAASGSNNGTAGAPTGTGHSITAYPGGWYRVTISMNHVASPSYPTILLGDSASLFGGSNQPFYSATTPYKGLLVWGAQLETGSGASSYIPTGASQGSRVADSCAIVSPNFAPWYNQGEGTFLLHCQLNRLGAQHLLNVNVNNAAPRLMITELSNLFNAAGENPSGTNFSFAIGSSSTNSTKVIAAFKSLDSAGTRNGGTVQTNATLTVPTTVNLMRIGSAEGGYQYMTGTISLLKYWPTRLPNAQLQSLTT